MYKIVVISILFIFMALGNMGGCGGGGGGCDFDFDSFLNGANSQAQTTQWDCLADDGTISTFAAFEDGTGVDTTIGVFTYERTGCRSASYQGSLDSGEVVNLEGSIESGILTFIQLSDNFGEFNVGCVLEVL